VVFRSLLPLLCLGLAPAAASAQEGIIPGTFEFSPQGGVSFPSGNLADLTDTGYNLGGQLGFYATPQAAVGFGILYNSFDLDPAIADTATGGTVAIWEFTVFGKFLLTNTQVRPYLRVSAGGFYNDGVVDLGGAGNERVELTSTKFGAGAGAGAQYRIPGSVGFFAEGMGMVDFTEGESTVYYVLHAGLNIYFAWSHP
jgi:hypothetical protein